MRFIFESSKSLNQKDKRVPFMEVEANKEDEDEEKGNTSEK